MIPAKSRSKGESFFYNLERTVSKVRKRKSEHSEFDEMLQSNPELIEEMGPVLGLIAFIFDSPLP